LNGFFMKFPPTLLNAFLLILPLLAWNIVLGPKITDGRITSDAHSPKWLLAAENLTRILVFALPLLIPLGGANWQFALPKSGWVVYVAGTLVYFASWLPLLLAPGSAWSDSPAGLLAPRLTPYLSFLGIALLGGSWSYAGLSALFIFFHTWHGVQNL
jgi:hypothetical protein